MPQTDILNPTPTHPLNPDYGFQKKRPVTHLVAKANQGVPYYRELTDTGHQFVFNWADKPRTAIDRLKWYYEQYRDGFFTYIDHEDGGRQYVGRFSAAVEPVPTAHGRWTVQGVTFDEIATAPMLKYPNRWDTDSVWRFAVNDFSQRMVAAQSGSWTLAANSQAKSGYEFVNANTNTTDTAAYQYVGYGFQFWARTGPNMGQANLILDGTSLGTLDFYSAAAISPNTQGSSPLLAQLNVPLGVHLVQLVALNTKNSASSGSTIVWDALRVMR